MHPAADVPIRLDILVVEDHPGLVANLFDFLEARGHGLDVAANGVRALALLREHRYDVVVLDWLMPRLDGIGVLKAMRCELGLDTPVIMVSAKGALDDKVEGFRAGVDDYLVKPFELPELELRCLALSHRKARQPRRLVVEDVQLDLDTLECLRGTRPVALFPATRKLLTLLMRESPNVVSRARLTDALWQDAPPDGDLLRRHVHELRKQLVHPGEAPLLHSVSGVGYVLRKTEAI